LFLQGFSSRAFAPLFGLSNSSVSNEAAQRKSSHQHPIQIKPFRPAPKEMPVESFPRALSSGHDHDKLQFDLPQAEMTEQQSSVYPTQLNSETSFPIANTGVTPSNSNGAQLSETPRNLHRQAFIVLKASPNISANGGKLIHISVFVQVVEKFTCPVSCRCCRNVSLSHSNWHLERS
jgi:hypothetical protein